MHGISNCPTLATLFVAAAAIGTNLALPEPLAAQEVRPISGYFTPEDYPQSSQLRGEEGVTHYILSINEYGRPFKCDIPVSSGYIDLDQKTCQVFIEKFIFDVPKNKKRNQNFPFHGSIKWAIGISDTRKIDGFVTVKESISKVDAQKTRCEFSDGLVTFVRASTRCAETYPSRTALFTQQMPAPKIAATPQRQDLPNGSQQGSRATRTNLAVEDFTRAQTAYKQGNHAEAFRLTLKAARGGLVIAQTTVAWYYKEGVGTDEDLQKSSYWLTQAANSGDSRANHDLSMAYIYGKGVPIDFQKSYDYAIKAKALGYNGGQEIFSSIKRAAGENNYNCMEFGFRFGTTDFSQCLMQLQHVQQQAERQAQIASRQAELAQRQYELEMRRYEQELAAFNAQQAALEREESRRQSQYLMRLSQGLLRGESFSEASMAAQGTPLTKPTRPQPPQAPKAESPFVCFPTAAALNCRPRP